MDNKEEIDLKIPSEEEQQKILAEISKEEIVDLNSLPRKEVEAIYIEDTPSKALEKLLSLKQASLQERQVYVRHLGELMSILPREGIDSLTLIFEQVLKDSDEIKKSLITQLPQICSLLIKELDGYELIKVHVIPVLSFFLNYNNLDIKEEAGNEIARIAPFLNEEDRGNLVLKQMINMSHDEQNEENKIVAVQLFGKLSSVFGQSLVESFIAFEILALGEDLKQRVRKEAILQIANVGKATSLEFLKSKLLPFFYNKCTDKAWVIRKTCLEIIVEVSRICPQEIRDNELTNQMITFFKDSNKWVKSEAYKQLGLFIESLKGGNKLNDKLLDEYCKMLTPEVKEYFATENEAIQLSLKYILDCGDLCFLFSYCSDDLWIKQMALIVENLLLNVKRPLACSLHEVAKILGPARAEKELIPVLDAILKDLNDEVKQGAIKNLWQFINVFEKNKRDNLLDVFLILFKDQKKWRVRQMIARQLDELSKIFQPEVVFQIIFPISLKLCNDIVSQVRKKAAKKMYALLDAMNQEDENTEIYRMCIIENLRAFSQSNRFNQRQTFALMCQNLMRSSLFEEFFLPSLVELSNDKVVNVRITVALTIKNHLKKNGLYQNHLQIKEMIRKFKNDPSQSVAKVFPEKSSQESPLKLIYSTLKQNDL